MDCFVAPLLAMTTDAPLRPACGEKMSAQPTDEGQLAAPERASAASSAERAVDRMEASFFRSFAAVNGALGAPPPAVEDH